MINSLFTSLQLAEASALRWHTQMFITLSLLLRYKVHCQGRYPNSVEEEVTEHWSFIITIIIKYSLSDQIKDGIGGACGMRGGI
jgi:hypothetical protein